ncbi:hypothetical protein LOD99_4150 [Oopsacas minuta]|uniref:Uncharacterized protein n=1 Tax=Oopsacas minuta TaxID=111878 RepID=A0AAV7JW85_9METZ|nr:hypothetical protein LOD99_4150 [Oopsacas minuta]
MSNGIHRHTSNKQCSSPNKVSLEEKSKSLYSKMIPFDLQPIWLKDNEFLQTNYRPINNSYWKCIKTMFLLHTETFNIWTHLLGCVFVCLLTLSALYIHTFKLSDVKIQLSSLPTIDKAMFSLFAISAASCLLGSTTFHIFTCHSESTAKFLNKIDYLGTTVCIIGSSLPLIYYGFFCHPWLIFIYCTVFLVGGGLCCYISFSDTFRRRDYRKVRPTMFILLGLTGIIPICHIISMRGFTEVFDRYALHWLCMMAFCYIFGAFIYSMRIPERFFPGKFDIFAHSHQIFHMFVIFGIISHYECLTSTVSYYSNHQSICQANVF